MSQISPELLSKAMTAPDQDFNVLVTVNNGALPTVPGLSGTVLMENIFSGKASGTAIQALQHLAEVVAVEPDYDMHALQDEIVVAGD
jgi:hypothetical protein